MTVGRDALSGTASIRDWIQLIRPAHWVKNFFVLGPLFFSGQAFVPVAVVDAVLAFAAFCVASSGVYLFNDALDEAADRMHPVKRLRPIAAGRVRGRDALAAAVALSVFGVGIAALVGYDVVVLVLAYLVLNGAYTMRLKQMVVVDVFVLASFYVIRLLAGAAAVHVVPSIWLLLCGGLLALYLGFTKRRHELVLLGDESASHRSVLSRYTAPFLDQMSTVLLSVTTVCYVMYTLESETADAVNAELLAYSTGFVLFGVFRYLYLVHNNKGGSPTHTLLGDRQLLLVVALWVFYCGLVIYQPR